MPSMYVGCIRGRAGFVEEIGMSIYRLVCTYMLRGQGVAATRSMFVPLNVLSVGRPKG